VSSTFNVNFSLRPNKAIERGIVFDGLSRIMAAMGLKNLVYVGFGSIWFSDFELAHRQLGLETMISIEADSMVYKRALFNKPYRTIEVVEGRSGDVLPSLLERTDLSSRPWVVWLDYDSPFDEGKLDELSLLSEKVPENSFLLTTFSARPSLYARRPADRPDRIRELLGDAAPRELTVSDCSDEPGFMRMLSAAVLDRLKSNFLSYARDETFFSTQRLHYKDGAPMITVGCCIASASCSAIVEGFVSGSAWEGISERLIEVPLLTIREAQQLRAALPRKGSLSRADVEAMGFDLREDQVSAFERHYLRYPSFAQVAI
jgi:hypothetical protein